MKATNKIIHQDRCFLPSQKKSSVTTTFSDSRRRCPVGQASRAEVHLNQKVEEQAWHEPDGLGGSQPSSHSSRCSARVVVLPSCSLGNGFLGVDGNPHRSNLAVEIGNTQKK